MLCSTAKLVLVSIFATQCAAMSTVQPDIDVAGENITDFLFGNETDFFDGNGTNVTTPEPPITEDPFCVGYRPGDDKHSFQLKSAGAYFNFTCLPPLVWSQEECSCASPPVEIEDPNCPHHRPYPDDPRKYEVRANGVWLPAAISCPVNQIWMQSNCWCDFDPNAPIPPEVPDGAVEETTTTSTTRTTTSTPPRIASVRGFVVTKGVLVESETNAPSVGNISDTSYCRGFRPADDPKQFQLESAGTFYNFTCPDALVWSQKDCSCQPIVVDTDDSDCPYHRPHPEDKSMFEAWSHGVWYEKECPSNQVWNQSNCWCDWDPEVLKAIDSDPSRDSVAGAGPCFPVFNATFDRGIIDDGPLKLAIGRQPWTSVRIEQDVPGAMRGSARIENGRMPLWFTGGNPLGGTLQIQFRFKLNEEKTDERRTIILLGNDRCSSGPTTLSIRFKPTDGQYSVFFRDYNVTRILECNVPSQNLYSFHIVDMVFFNELLTLTIDGIECFGALFETDLLPTPCFMALGSRHFDGWFDNVIFRKDCLEQGNR